MSKWLIFGVISFESLGATMGKVSLRQGGSLICFLFIDLWSTLSSFLSSSLTHLSQHTKQMLFNDVGVNMPRWHNNNSEVVLSDRKQGDGLNNGMTYVHHEIQHVKDDDIFAPL